MNHLDFNNKFEIIWNSVINRHYRLESPVDETECCDEKSLFAALEIEKTDLNSVKSLLNSVDIVAWHRHTTNMHLFSNISVKLRHQIKAELPTQAWAKFYCILWNYDLIKEPLDGKVFRSVHLCEAPGAFITSLNHFLKNNFSPQFRWDWLGTTLNPYYESNELGKMIPDDRFIINTLDKWYFGTDFTGNIMDLNNLNDLKKKLKDKNVDLVTADGSIDCSDDPGEQELIVTPLFLWEILTALHVLSKGGAFVIKMFTVFEKSTVVLLFLLSEVFEEVNLFKPGPSKPGNSEVYIVARGFNATKCHEMKLFNDLQEIVVKGDIKFIENLVDFSKVSKRFLDSVRDYVEESCSLQKAAIQANRRAFQQMTARDEDQLRKMKTYFAKKFVNEYRIKKIQDFTSPMFKLMVSQGQFKNTQQNMNYKIGSLEQRRSSENKRFKSTDGELSTAFCSSTVEWYEGLDIPLSNSTLQFQPILGKNHHKIRSSLFCNPSSLEILHNQVAPDGCNIDNMMPRLVNSFDMIFKQCKCTVKSDNDSFRKAVESQLTTLQNINNDNEVSEQETVMFDLQNLTIDVECKKRKLQAITNFLSTLKETKHRVCFHFHELLLSSFWVGVFYLLSSLYKDVSYYCPGDPKSCLFFVCNGNKEDGEERMKNVQVFFEKCLQTLGELSDEVNMLHVLPIPQLMLSDFRQYVKRCNNSFIESFSN